MPSQRHPHRGRLQRRDEQHYQLDILIDKAASTTHALLFSRHDWDWAQRLFAILDYESRGAIDRETVHDFLKLRCPVLAQREDSFAQVWTCTLDSSLSPVSRDATLTLEGWMVLCRFLSLLQYLEAKRRFSARHLQQTMKHRNSPRGSELVVVEVPPLEPPTRLTPRQLYEYEQSATLPMPELDLDHGMVAAHRDSLPAGGTVQVTPFGQRPPPDFVLAYQTSSVRRSLADCQWLDETLRSHNLCGRILPPFPQVHDHDRQPTTRSVSTTTKLVSHVGRLTDAAKSLFFATERPTRQHSPHALARSLERYFNYLLEHPALSASFPLQAMLKASQSGLEAAKLCLEECPEPQPLHEGRLNLKWIRTAAQAAMALQIHDLLETTGLQSASARLQHLSLPPTFASGPRDDDKDEPSAEPETSTTSTPFEDGVVTVGGLDDEGYDWLPEPVMAPDLLRTDPESHKDRYSYEVDENVESLRDVIGSVANTMARCQASSGTIRKALKERQDLHLGILRGLDSWEGMRGQFVTQRSLMKGVSGIEHSADLYEESGSAIVEDLTWQSALASSAVSAAEDVREAVRAYKTAQSAKAAASSAAGTAQSSCENGTFGSVDEARAAQTRASIAQSHAIHAAVVEHEADSFRRRSTLALANDVKSWNSHRKREMLRSCLELARSQHEATRRAVDAWSALRDGFVKPSILPSERHGTSSSSSLPSIPSSSRLERDESGGAVAAVLHAEKIVAVEHTALMAEPVAVDDLSSDIPFATADPIPAEEPKEEAMSASMQSLVDGLIMWGGAFDADDFNLPVGMAASIAMEESGLLSSPTKLA